VSAGSRRGALPSVVCCTEEPCRRSATRFAGRDQTASSRPRVPRFQDNPQKRGVCVAIFTQTPKKPTRRSARVARVRPDERNRGDHLHPRVGHNLQEHSLVLIRGGPRQGPPGRSQPRDPRHARRGGARAARPGSIEVRRQEAEASRPSLCTQTRSSKRELLPDPVYGNNAGTPSRQHGDEGRQAEHGRKPSSTAPSTSSQDKTGDDPARFQEGGRHVKPTLEVKSRRVAVELPGADRGQPERRLSLSIRWLVHTPGRAGDGKTDHEKLATSSWTRRTCAAGRSRKKEAHPPHGGGQQAFAHFRGRRKARRFVCPRSTPPLGTEHRPSWRTSMPEDHDHRAHPVLHRASPTSWVRSRGDRLMDWMEQEQEAGDHDHPRPPPRLLARSPHQHHRHARATSS